jgi:pimeloyl-ACP methyl ester carboxylesterase
MVKVYKSEKGKSEILKTYDVLLGNWGIDFEEFNIETRYGITHVITAGDEGNPPLVLFHGVGDDSAMMWIKNAKVLADSFRIYAIDTIGGPGKSVPNDDYGKDFELCLWIDDILDELKLDKVSIAGVSNGAYITQAYGSRRPERTDKIVCMAGGLAAGDKNPGLLEMIKTMKVFFPEALFPSDKSMRKLVQKLCGENAESLLEDIYIMEHWNALLKHFNQMAMGYHKLNLLNQYEVENIKNRCIFIIGDKDPIAYSQKAIDLFIENEMQYKVFKNAGHAINHEIPDIINSILVEFLL